MSTSVGHWTVEEYDAAVSRGTFGPEPRIELIQGEIYAVTPIGPRHASVVRHIARLAQAQVSLRFEIGVQDPIVLGDRGEPEPDLWLARNPGSYRDQHPRGVDLALVIEVSDTTLDHDLFVKVPMYLEHDVSEIWVVDLVHRRIVTFDPAGKQLTYYDGGVVVHRESGLTLDMEALFS
jgi:Uma2 family endonuclease